MKIRIGVGAAGPSDTPAALAELVTGIDELGFDSPWLWEVLRVTLASAIAASSEVVMMRIDQSLRLESRGRRRLCVLQPWRTCLTIARMKTLTVRLPAALVKDLEAESRERHRSKSDIVRERLSLAARSRVPATPTDTIADLVGSVDGLPVDLSRRKKAYLKTTGYGRKRAR